MNNSCLGCRGFNG